MARKTAAEAEQSRQQIMRSARAIFVEKGYGAASMEEIRGRSGMSKGSIYYHFKSKQQLFLAILEQNIQDWLDKWKQIAQPDQSLTDKLHALAVHWVLDFDNPLISAGDEFVASHSDEPEVIKKMIALTQLHHPIIRDILEQGIAAGELRQEDPDMLTYLLFGTLGGLGMAHYDQLPRAKVLALYRMAIEVFLHGVQARQPV
ncbi:TetR/AcrR family transcriptional regulator [Paenibacillus sp. IB182496]|uniref:TetR/AcrR family transcriptional regulator n=1 Tax=Paenibacillus sabuli TaxID=2772509 RepID=A0A927BVK3_9BACL|nr:TetR/AcrR family transcriptional regulator [Paenibacillus sabuli]MBD2847147.1 TetR/AcrR family transcriptional regulator [Paenibacillus sabuli]